MTVTGAKGGVGTTVTAVQLALAARAAGRSVALVDLDLQSGDVASYLDVQFRRSIVDLAGIADISVRVLQDAVHDHHTGLACCSRPEEGERGEEVDDRAARQIIGALRSRYEVVLVDCGSQMQSANAAAVELADTALLVTTPDVVAVRAAKRQVRLWDRLQIRKAEDTTTVVNRLTRSTEIQPPLVAKATGTQVARHPCPGRLQGTPALRRRRPDAGPRRPVHGQAGALGAGRRTRPGRLAGRTAGPGQPPGASVADGAQAQGHHGGGAPGSGPG